MMKLYTQPNCAPCKTIKKRLKGMDADYVVVDDLIEFPDELRSVPTLEVEGKMISGGTNVLKYLNDLESKESQ